MPNSSMYNADISGLRWIGSLIYRSGKSIIIIHFGQANKGMPGGSLKNVLQEFLDSLFYITGHLKEPQEYDEESKYQDKREKAIIGPTSSSPKGKDGKPEKCNGPGFPFVKHLFLFR